MYAVIEKNRLEISVAEFYTMDWYRKDQFLPRSEKHEIDYGYLKIDVHRNGKKYLTGFVIAENFLANSRGITCNQPK